MTDNEIIKALECCISNELAWENCPDCPYRKYRLSCMDDMLADAISLINRQQAEIERLKNGLAISQKETKRILVTKGGRGYGKTKAEAIKEFAERLKKLARPFPFFIIEAVCGVTVTDIDNLVKEMVGGDNAQ